MATDPATFYSKLLEKLVARIRERGVRQTDLAKCLGLPQPSISNLLSGKTRLTMDQFFRIAIYLGIQPSEVLASAETASELAGEMPEEMLNVLYESDDNFIVYMAATIPLREEAIVPYVGCPDRVSSAKNKLIKAGLLCDSKEGFVQIAPSQSFYLRKSLLQMEIYRKVIKRLWEFSDRNIADRNYRKDRYNYYYFDRLTEVQAGQLDGALWGVYEMMNRFSAQNMLANYEGLGRTRFWGVHILMGTPLEP